MITGKSQESKRLIALLRMIRSVTGCLKEQNSFRAFPCEILLNVVFFLQFLDYVY
jgi:hypothetical protein